LLANPGGAATFLPALIVLIAGLLFVHHHPASAQPARHDCIVVDSDAALDDFRAVAALAPTGRIVAIVVTEGISRPEQGAVAMVAMLRRGGFTIPVLPGVAADPGRGYVPDRRLEEWRRNAESLNGMLGEPAVWAGPPLGDLGVAIRRHTAGCAKTSLLVIGPWTSFMRYAAELIARADQIVAQGRPYPDELGGEPTGFNCLYDQTACFAAFDLLVGRQQRAGRRLRVDWVDIPSGPERCGSAEPGIDAEARPLFAFRPTREWSDALHQAGGMARVVAEMLRANPEGWQATSLWDDLAALYLLRRDVFVARGGHLEPCVPANTIRQLLMKAMAGH
jgi:hypothetical protein